VRAENDECPGEWSEESTSLVYVKGQLSKMDLETPPSRRVSLDFDWSSLNDECMVAETSLELKNSGTGWEKGDSTTETEQAFLWLPRESDSEWDDETNPLP
jgi:hypothetical protein